MVTDDEQILRNVSDSMHMLLLAGESVRFQKNNVQNLLSRVKLLKPAIDYLREVKIPLPKQALGPFQALDDALQKAKDIVEECSANRSKIYLAYRCPHTVASFQNIAAELSKVIDSIPLSTLHIASLTRSQIERCNQELRRLKFTVDARDSRLSDEISFLLKDFTNNTHVNSAKLKSFLQQMDLDSRESISKELTALQCLKSPENNTVLNQVISMLTSITEDATPGTEDKEQTQNISIPADFCCPLSQKLMCDPVIVASGQTYERVYIQQWLDQGNKTCPKTQQTLTHTNLIPNYTVKALIANWCEMNNVPLPEPPKVEEAIKASVSSPKRDEDLGNSTKKDEGDSLPVSTGISSSEMDQNHEEEHAQVVDDADVRYFLAGISRKDLQGDGDVSEEKSPRFVYRSRKERSRLKLGNNEKLFDIMGTDEGKESRIRNLVGDLNSPLLDAQRAAAAELRLLAKNNAEDRIRIANAGAIKSFVSLLSSSDPKVQEDSVTSLLNLSLNDGNKYDIVEAGAVSPLINVLSVGNPEARQNAAATLFSLSVKQEYTMLIGNSGAIPPLVELLKDGTPRGKKDAATALFNLSICHENKTKVVKAGAVKPLIDLICEPRLGMVDKAVAVVANLSTVPDGRHAIVEDGGIPALAEVVEAGSQRGKEHAAAALLTICTNSQRHRAMVFNEGVTPMLHILSQTGTARGKEKASALLRLFREQRNGNVPGPHHHHHHHHHQERHASPHY